ncbi:anion permease [Escherichia coli]
MFCLMVGAAIRLGSILTPVRHPNHAIYYGSGYLPTADYWRLGGDFWADIPRIAGDYRLLWMPWCCFK